MESLRTKAEAFILALNVGGASVDDVVAWAREVLETSDHPHWSICELALCSEKYPPDVAACLRDVPGSSDRAVARRLLLQMLATSLVGHPERADQIARALFDLALAGEIDDARIREIAWWAWDALDLADAGYISATREQVIAQMRDGLAAAVASTENGTPA